MKISTRSILMAGVTTLTASAVAIAPSVQPPPPPRPAIQLAASVQQPLAAPTATGLTEFLQRILLAPSIGTPPPPPPPIVVPTPGSIGSSITAIYDAIEPWANWVSDLAEYAVGWIPYVGWLAPQIDIFYHFGEQIVRSIVYNIAGWLDGNFSFAQGLVNVGVDTINAFIYLANRQIDFWLPPLPPLPPIDLPCIFRCNTLALTTLMDPTEAPGVGVENAGSLQALLDRVLNPLNVGGDVERVEGGASLSSLFRNGIAEISDLLGGPLSPPSQEKMSEINTVPSIVKTPFTPLKSLLPQVDPAGAGPLAEVTKTVRDVRKEVRASFNERRADKLAAAGDNVVVRTQAEGRGPIANAANDIVNVVRGSKSDSDADGAKAPSTTVVNSVRDTVKKVVKDVREAAKDARQSVKDQTSDDE